MPTRGAGLFGLLAGGTQHVVLGPRQYDPTTSRFTTPDVFVASALDLELGADELTGNRYLFAGANPVAFYEDGHGIGLPKIKIPSPLKAVKKLAKKALPFVPVVGAGIEAVSIASGRDWLEGGRKMSGSERVLRTGMLAGGAVLGVGATKVAAKVVEKAAGKAKAVAPKASGLADDVAAGVGRYGDVGGHHIHAKAAFKGHDAYSLRKGLAISQDAMRTAGIDHTVVSSAQRRLFDDLARSAAPNTMRAHSRIAVEVLRAGGADPATARSLVAHSLWNLRRQGVRQPWRIPWN